MIVISTRTAMTEFVVSLNVQSKASDMPMLSLPTSTQAFVVTLDAQAQAPDDPHDPPRHFEVLCTVAP